MQKALDRIDRDDRPQKPEKPAGKTTVITAPKFSVLTVPIVNMPGSPLVIHAFSAKSRQMMREAQEMGSVGKKRKQKDPKDFDEVYRNACYVSRDGWYGASAATFRNAMISACRLVAFKMTIGKMSVFVEADGLCAQSATPLIRIDGEPYPFEATVRNQTGVADIRVRPRWDEWRATLRIRYDTEQFSDDDVVNLVVRAGEQNGVGEGRPSSPSSFGQGWGLFRIDMSKPIEVMEIPAPRIEFVRK